MKEVGGDALYAQLRRRQGSRDNEGSGGQAAAGAEKSHRGDGQRRWQRRLLATNAEQQQHEAEKQCRELRR